MYQDWNEVVFQKKPKTTQSPHFEKSKEQRLEEDTDTLNHSTVGLSLGKQIQKARLANGIKTQKELASLINTKPDIINSYECGKAIPDNAVMQKLRRVLKTTFNTK